MRAAFTSSWGNALILRYRCNMSDWTSGPLLGKRSPPMTIPEVLHLAIAGGYHLAGADGGAIAYSGANNEYSAWTHTATQSSFLVPVQDTFLDPAFGTRWGGSWAGTPRVPSPSRAGTRRVSAVTAPPGCSSGIVVFSISPMGIRPPPSLPGCPPRAHPGNPPCASVGQDVRGPDGWACAPAQAPPGYTRWLK